jgi:hypothetical protein
VNFLIWRQGLRGPIASIDLFDPRQSADWKIHEQTLIEIVPLANGERDFTLDQAIAAHPCKETE